MNCGVAGKLTSRNFVSPVFEPAISHVVYSNVIDAMHNVFLKKCMVFTKV